MPREKNSGKIDLREMFLHIQHEMLASLAVRKLLEHPTVCGAATEHHWIDLFNRYLPARYSASSAFIVDADGNRSRQIDLAIYDRTYSPLLFSHPTGLHIPAESVYAVFEVKQLLNRKLMEDAASKAESVRRLRRTSVPFPGAKRLTKPPKILAGILALNSCWNQRFTRRLPQMLARLKGDCTLDLGCALELGAFEVNGNKVQLSTPEESLIFLMLRLIERLRAQGTAPAADLTAYARTAGFECMRRDNQPSSRIWRNPSSTA
jgi:hypothetical protein